MEFKSFYCRCLLTAIASSVSLVSDARGQDEVVPLVNGTADFSQPAANSFPSYIPAFAIDQNKVNDVGWAVFPLTGKPHTIVFETVSDSGFGDGTRYTFKLYHLHLNPGHSLGRFRLSATTDSRSSFADGKSVDGQVSANWTILVPSKAEAANGTILSILADNSVLASGPRPTPEVYTVVCDSNLVGVTGFRLEALTDSSLPVAGPGRAPNGNFLLTEVEVMAASIQPEISIEISEIRLRWHSEKGRLYQLEVATALVPGQWVALGLPIEGSGDEMSLVDRPVEGTLNRLYRIIRLP